MSSERSQPDRELTDGAWHEIDVLIEEIAGLSKSDMPVGAFHAEFLRRVISGLAAVGGEVWAAGTNAPLHCEHRILPASTESFNARDAEWHRHHLAAVVRETGKAKIVAAHASPGGRDAAQDATSKSPPAPGEDIANPTEFLVLACPWTVDGDLAGVVEVFQRPGAGPEAERGYLRFLQAMCELLADYHRNNQLRGLRQRAAEWRELDQLAEQVHRGLDLQATAYAIANEGRRVLGCDRVSVLVCRSGRCRLLAVSGVDVVERRASLVRELESLSSAVARCGEPLWYPRPAADHPPEIESRLTAYLDESHCRAIAIVPLKRAEGVGTGEASDSPSAGGAPETLGALVVEQFRGEFDERTATAVPALVGHSATALANSLELDRLPMAGLLRALGKARWFVEARQLPKTVLALLALVALVALLTFVPAEFRVESRGELQPADVRDVFAPADGVVAEVRTAHGQQVQANQVLLLLRKPEFDLEFQRVGGELQTARKKLASVEAERLQSPRDAEEQRRRYGQLTAQHEELRELIASLEGQYAILHKKRQELEVRSPVAGQVLTWNLEQLLAARPVNRGQSLMTVANLQGPWQLELRIPDHRVAHVLTAQQQAGAELDVSFVLATEPGAQRRGTLTRLGMRTEVAEPDGAFVPALVKIDRNEIPELMPGATVTAKIDCGRRAVGYVWLHDLLDAVRSWLWW